MQRSLADDLRSRRPEAIDRLLAELGVEIQAIAQVIVRDPDAAADVLEETVLAAWTGARRIPDDDALRRWLLRTATRLALRRQPSSPRVAVEHALPGLPDSVVAALPDTQRIILESLALLAPRERAIVALTCLADLPPREAAEALGVRPRTAEELLDTAIAELQYSLVDDAAPTASIVELHRV